MIDRIGPKRITDVSAQAGRVYTLKGSSEATVMGECRDEAKLGRQ